MAYVLLALAQLLGLVLIPFGLPGLWVQFAALTIFAWGTDFATVGPYSLALVGCLALAAEIAEFLLAGRFARRFGGGRRAALGAMLGAVIGAVLGVPVPLVGSVIGAMLGAFAGAMLLELTRGVGPAAARAGWGAMLGFVTSVALKAGLGVVVALFTLFVAIR